MVNSVCIILVNYNSTSDTIECVNSLIKIDHHNFSIIIVDNHSDAAHFESLYKHCSSENRITIIRVNDNLGFAGGNNVGIKNALASGSEFICLLNNDTIVEPDFLTKLISRYDDSIGILSPLICYYLDRKKIWAAGGRISKLRGSGFAYHLNENISEVRGDKYVDFASGCCMLFHRSLIDQIGYLDENFFLYLEDTDFSFRTTHINKKILIVKDSVIYHKVNASTKKDHSLLPLYYTTRNRLYFSKKNFGIIYILTHLYLKLTFWIKKDFASDYSNALTKNVIKKAFEDFNNNKLGKLTEPLG